MRGLSVAHPGVSQWEVIGSALSAAGRSHARVHSLPEGFEASARISRGGANAGAQASAKNFQLQFEPGGCPLGYRSRAGDRLGIDRAAPDPTLLAIRIV